MKLRTLLLIACALLMAGVATAQDLKVPDAEQFVGKPKGTPLTGEVLNTRTNQVGGLLRCPVCQGLSVSDSPSEMAVNMKGQVRELLQRGYTEEQILAYFERSYGQFVLLKPKFEGVNRLVWILPLLALLLGGTIVIFKLRNLERAPVVKTTTDAERRTPNAAAEDPYLARVRELMNGEKQ